MVFPQPRIYLEHMKTRMDIPRVEPAVFKAMLGLDGSSRTTGLNPVHRYLLQIRASQINGCAYCIDNHVNEAIAAGETHRRLHGLAAWKESSFFTDEEKTLLSLTEEVTLIQVRVSDTVWNKAQNLWNEAYLAQVLLAIITVNAWNEWTEGSYLLPDTTHGLAYLTAIRETLGGGHRSGE